MAAQNGRGDRPAGYRHAAKLGCAVLAFFALLALLVSFLADWL